MVDSKRPKPDDNDTAKTKRDLDDAAEEKSAKVDRQPKDKEQSRKRKEKDPPKPTEN